jgi:Uma2 family endonuclease
VLAAKTGLKIDNLNVRAPDCAFVSKERVQQHGIPKSFFPYASDLAIEVVSPGDTKAEVKEKTEWWLAVGTRLVLVIDSKRKTVTAHRANRMVSEFKMGDVLEGFDLVPGFSLPVEEVFK